MALRAVRTGVTPVERPTEWVTALAMFAAAVVAWRANRDTAALIAVGGAVLPTLATAVTAWWESRHAVPATPVVSTVGSE